jgi:predicted AlkP superfamily phosphohydrolase/phosphomutase
MPSEQKVFLIGLDGATWTLLEPLMSEGLLPNLARLRERGAWGSLWSTIPFVTAPAWTSFATGKHPGKHGLFDWRLPLRGNDTFRRFANASHIQEPRFWELLANAGRRVGLLNVPMTYPPRPTNGFIVSGMLTPSLQHHFAEPRALEETLREIPGFQIDLRMAHYDDGNVGKFVQDLSRMTRARFEAARLLVERYDPDLFMIVSIGPDRIQHIYWHILDPQHPRHDSGKAARLAPLLKQWYCELDSLIGQLIASRPSETLTIVMSDHGFGPAVKRIDLNRWLASEGFLNFNGREFQKRRWQFYVDALLRRNKRLHKLLSTAKKLLLGSGDMPLNERSLTVASLIDRCNSQAYSGTSTEQGIWINLAGREPRGVVQADKGYELVRDQIMAKVTGIRDPDTDQQVVSRACRREDVYEGGRIADAPDIILTLADGYEVGVGIMLLGSRFIFPVDGHYLLGSGNHRRDGVFIIEGPGVQPGRAASDKSIVDLAPTILHLMGHPIPGDIDGSVMTDIFKPAFSETHPVITSGVEKTQAGADDSDSVFTEEDERTVYERLAGLGYIG